MDCGNCRKFRQIGGKSVLSEPGGEKEPGVEEILPFLMAKPSQIRQQLLIRFPFEPWKQCGRKEVTHTTAREKRTRGYDREMPLRTFFPFSLQKSRFGCERKGTGGRKSCVRRTDALFSNQLLGAVTHPAGQDGAKAKGDREANWHKNPASRGSRPIVNFTTVPAQQKRPERFSARMFPIF